MPATHEQVTLNFLDQLRNATQEQHNKLEETNISKNLLSDNVTLNDYVLYLTKMKSVIHFSEQNIFPFAEDIISDINIRKKEHLIQNDLTKLPFKLKLQTTYLPSLKNITVPFALGYIYVIEGSTLGGRFISKHIKSKLGIDENNGGSFFEGYGAVTGKTWKNFLEMLCRYAEETQSADEIIVGAKHAFESIYNYFKQ